MKEMIYINEQKRELLDTGIYKNYKYYIMSLGTHPTAYIEIPEESKLYNKNYDDIYINVPGGLTYSQDYLYISETKKLEGWFIGWDYAHYGDYYGGYTELLQTNGSKKWTTEEILEEVKDAIEQLLLLNGFLNKSNDTDKDIEDKTSLKLQKAIETISDELKNSISKDVLEMYYKDAIDKYNKAEEGSEEKIRQYYYAELLNWLLLRFKWR